MSASCPLYYAVRRRTMLWRQVSFVSLVSLSRPREEDIRSFRWKRYAMSLWTNNCPFYTRLSINSFSVLHNFILNQCWFLTAMLEIYFQSERGRIFFYTKDKEASIFQAVIAPKQLCTSLAQSLQRAQLKNAWKAICLSWIWPATFQISTASTIPARDEEKGGHEGEYHASKYGSTREWKLFFLKTGENFCFVQGMARRFIERCHG